MPIFASNRFFLSLTLIIFCGFSGCGGGGAGGGSTTPQISITGNGLAPTTGPGDTQSYFPLSAGDQWWFNSTKTDPNYPNSPPAVANLVTQVNGTKSILGQNATVISQSGAYLTGGAFDQYYIASAGGISYLGTSDTTDKLSAQIAPYSQLLFPVSTGTVSNITGNNLKFGTDTAGNPITLSITQSVVNLDVEAVDVPAGTFTTSVKQITTITGTANDKGQSVAISGSETTWLVPGIGAVKDITVATGAGVQITQTAELRGCMVSGKHFGFGVPIFLSPQAGASYSTGVAGFGAGPYLGTDGTNFLVVTQQFPASAAGSLQNWTGSIVAPDGHTIASFNLNPNNALVGTSYVPYAAVAFDGTNYLVVYTQDHLAPQATTLDAVRVSSTGAIVGTASTVATLSILGIAPFALAFDGSQYLLVYPAAIPPSTTQLLGILIAPNSGQPTGAAFQLVSGTTPLESYGPALVFDGINFLLVWEQNANSGSQLLAERISNTGMLLDATPISIMVSQVGLSSPNIPAVAFDGTNYLVAYVDYTSQTPGNGPGISATRISTAGLLLDAGPLKPGIVVEPISPQGSDNVSVAFLAGQYYVVWHTQGPTQQKYSQINSARISTSGVLTTAGVSGFPVEITNNSSSPNIVSNANSALISMNAQNFSTKSIQTLFPAKN